MDHGAEVNRLEYRSGDSVTLPLPRESFRVVFAFCIAEIFQEKLNLTFVLQIMPVEKGTWMML